MTYKLILNDLRTDLSIVAFQCVYQSPSRKGVHKQRVILGRRQEERVIAGKLQTAYWACQTILDHINHAHILDVPLHNTLIGRPCVK